ncbi:MAG: hypothetical protein ACYDHW_07115 [Syntrophorhabdaceae bacterium]
MHIIQNLYGNNGYAFFYKLLEVLGDAEGHYYDCRDETSKEFLAAQTHVDWITGAEILNKLCSMRVIDADLWNIGVIWMDSFVESVKDAYRKRAISVPVKPQVSVFLPPEMQDKGISTAGSTQSKVNKTKLKESKEKSIGDKPPTPRFISPTLEQVEMYCRERNNRVNAKKWLDHYTSNGWKVGKNKMVDWKAAVRTWEEDQGGFNGNGNNRGRGASQSGTQTQDPGYKSEYPVDLEETIGDY